MLREIKKIFAAILVGIIAVALCATPVNAISLTNLERVSEDSESIEINEATEGYDFDANFLAKNQELQYRATLINDEGNTIKIDNISLNESEYDFLEYSYDGINVNDTLSSGETKDITITVKTNSNDTTTVVEDYDLNIDYTIVEPVPDPDEPDTPDTPEDRPETNPNTITTKNIITKTAAVAVGISAAAFLIARNKKLRQFAIVFTISSLGICCLASNVEAEEQKSFHILGKIHFTNIYTVTVNPNGGIYNNTAENTVVQKREGETYHVDTATREHFEFQGWEVNPGELDSDNNIEIHHDTTIKAKWNENTYTLTINPNGGEYLGSTDIWSESYRPNEVASISAPEKEGYNFVYWTVEEDDSTFSGSSLTMVKNVTLVANYEIKTFTITVIPNGGTYHGSTNTYTTTVDWNTDYPIEAITREGYDLKSWTKDGNQTLAPDTQTINIKANTTIEANWWSSTFYTVTINPNGGIYDNTTEISSYQVREGTDYTMLEATKENYVFDYWHYTDSDTRFNETTFTVTQDVNLTAEYSLAVARIERTGKLYPSIMAAHNDANPNDITNDTITLLVDTTEIVTNSKQVTLDLNTHTVTGYLTNTAAGNLTLINGVFDNYQQNEDDENNPNGAAVINNGTLTIGIDDYTENEQNAKAPIINPDYVKLFGNHYGLEQNGTFYYYDGIIEAEIGLKGGYHGSPWFRDMSDGKEIHYFPFVSRNYDKDCQHVQLESSNLAVSKTVDQGEIYYYNLQDNVDTSAETGYIIHIVRDFTASYTVTVDAGDTINIDLENYTIDSGYDWTNNGTLNIYDDATSTNELNFSRTFTNNSTLTLTNVRANAVSPNTLLNNTGTLNLANTALASDTATALEFSGDGATLNADNNSNISTTNKNYVAVSAGAANAVINGGNFSGAGNTVSVAKSTQLTVNSGNFTTTASTGANIFYSQGTLIFNDGNITHDSDASVVIKGIYSSSTLRFNGGSINIKSKGSIYGIHCSSHSDCQINSGEITVESSGSSVTGIYGTDDNTVIQKGENTATAPIITATATGNSAATGIDNAYIVSDATVTTNTNSGAAKGISSVDHTYSNISNVTVTVSSDSGNAYGINACRHLSSGTITATSVSNKAYGVYAYTMTTDGGTVIATSESDNAYGYYGGGGSTVYSSTINDGSFTGTTNNPEKLGYGAYADRGHNITVAGGNLTGTNFGLTSISADRTATIGVLDDNLNKNTPIIKGGDYGVDAQYINFYDGTLIGGTNYILDHGNIQTIPSSASYHIETNDDGVNCWLVLAQNYLHNIRLNRDYNSLDAAYGDEDFESGDTLKVLADNTTEAIQPNNDSVVTIDLDGHTLTFTQPILNSGTMTITDSSEAKGGKIQNVNVKNYTIDNSGNLTIESSEISGTCRAIYSHASGNTLTISNKSLISMGDALGSNCSSTIRLTNTTAKIDNSTVQIDSTTAYNATAISGDSGSTLTIDNSDISAKSTKTSSYAIDRYNNTGFVVHLNSGNIYAFSGTDPEDPSTYTGITYGIAVGTLYVGTENTADNTTPTVTAIGRTAYACGGDIKNIYNGTIEAKSSTGAANALYNNTANIYSGSIKANSVSGESYGANLSTLTMNAGEITSYSKSNSSYGIKTNTIKISNGNVSAAKNENNTKNAIGVEAKQGSITGGTIYGDNYGLNNNNSSASSSITLGVLDNTLDKDAFTITGGDYGIYDGYIYFYDGTIIGKNAEGYDYIYDRTDIKAIPAGSTYNITTTDDQIKCWLVEASEFLLNTRLNQRYSSFDAAFTDEYLQDGDTLEVLESNTSEALIPANTHNITLDLHGFTVTNSQPIPNSGTLTVTDLSDGKNGILQSNNTSNTAPAILNTGTLNIKAGTIAGLYDAIKNTSSGTVNQTGGTVKATGNAADSAIYSTSGTINITGGSVSIENRTGSYASTTTFAAIAYEGGTVSIKDAAITAYNNSDRGAYGIHERSSNKLDLTVTGDTSISVEAKMSAYGISGSLAQITGQDSHTPNITVTSTNYTAYGVDADVANSSKYATIKNATITVNANSVAYGLVNFNAATNNSITVTSTDNNACGLENIDDIINNTTTVTAKRIAYGTYGRNYKIESGTTTAHSTTDNAYGYYSASSHYGNSRDMQIAGGSVTATTDADNKLAYGYYSPAYTATTITGGNITGQHYGIYAEHSVDWDTLTIGNNDGIIYNGVDNSPADPIISGGTYGIYGGQVKLYDGRIRGGTYAYYDRNVKEIATDSYIHMTQEPGYDEVKYVSATEMLAKIGNGSCEDANTTCYPSLQAAVDAAQSGDTITLLADNYIFYTLTIPTEKNVVIELDGYTLITGNPINNSGTTTIQNSKANTRPVISYHEANYFIANSGSITFKNVDLEAYKLVDNPAAGSVTLDNVDLALYTASTNSNNYLIKNAGTLAIQNNSHIKSLYSLISQTGGTTTVSNSKIENTATSGNTFYLISISNGSLSINKSELISNDLKRSSTYNRLISQTGANTETTITNSSKLTDGELVISGGKLTMTDSSYTNNHTNRVNSIDISAGVVATFNHCTLALAPNGAQNSSYGYSAIKNAGTLNLTNGTSAGLTYTTETESGPDLVLYNSNTVTIDNSSVYIDSLNSAAKSNTKYVLYNEGATSSISITNGSSITANTNNTGETYGVYINNSSQNSGEGIYLGSTSSINVSAPKAYGVYMNNGRFAMGEKETVLIGQDIASKTDPTIRAISNNTSVSDATGQGITNIQGIFNFYDGKITGSTNAYTATITETEYWYEATKATDSDGYEYAYLLYMPNGSEEGGE